MTTKSTYKKGHAAGASKSIELTMNEIESILTGEYLEETESYLRTELREKIKESLTSLAMKWYKKGFNRGHKESFKGHVESNEFPAEISAEVSRSLLPKNKTSIKLCSRLKDDFVEEIEEKYTIT